METILTRVLDARKIYDSAERTFSLSPERFFKVGGIWVAIMQGDPLPERSYNHVAFKIAPEDIEPKLTIIRDLGLDLRDGRSRVSGEGDSIYFYDDDNHLFELHAGTREERLRRYERPPE